MEVANKIVTLDQLDRLLKHWRAVGDTVVFTNGCFDILHRGHASLLNECATLGDRVVVGLNSDISVKKLKGNERPIQSEQDRAYILASLKNVDAVIIFDEETPLKLIAHILPNVLVKGGDYQIKDIVGAEVVTHAGGKVILYPLIEKLSTTQIVAKINHN
jgi:rfaE bifunctional protein nucleotidyltransferase chain/domain